MLEVTAKLRFNRECLGAAQRRKSRNRAVFCMLRDHVGRVMFLPTWWRRSMQYAAKVANRGHALVDKVAWDPLVEGRLRPDWRRIVTQAKDDPRRRSRYAVHEAFPPGSELCVNAVLPDEMSVELFAELLAIVGTYQGVSPFVCETETFGTFEVLAVTPRIRDA